MAKEIRKMRPEDKDPKPKGKGKDKHVNPR